MIKSSRKSLRDIAFKLFDWFGANRLFRRFTRSKVRVFALHGVASGSPDQQWTPLRDQLDTGRLDEILGALSKDYQFISMDKVVQILSGNEAPVENGIALTFDDGYRNNFTQALPVLEKYSAPATFYIATDFVESRQPYWFDRLDYILPVAAEQGIVFEIGNREFRFDHDTRKELARKYKKLRRHCKSVFPDERAFAANLNSVAEMLEKKTGRALADIIESDPWACVVRAEELRELASHPLVTIGSHTISHIRLSFASDEAVEHELAESKRKLEGWTGQPVVHFAYPNGDYDARSMDAVKNAGYESAVTSDPGLNAIGTNSLEILRLSIPSRCHDPAILVRASGLECAYLNVAF